MELENNPKNVYNVLKCNVFGKWKNNNIHFMWKVLFVFYNNISKLYKLLLII